MPESMPPLFRYRASQLLAQDGGVRTYTAVDEQTGGAVLAHVPDATDPALRTRVETLLSGLGPADRAAILDTAQTEQGWTVVSVVDPQLYRFLTWVTARQSGGAAASAPHAAPAVGEFTAMFGKTPGAPAAPADPARMGLGAPTGEFTNFFGPNGAPVVPPRSDAPTPTAGPAPSANVSSGMTQWMFDANESRHDSRSADVKQPTGREPSGLTGDEFFGTSRKVNDAPPPLLPMGAGRSTSAPPQAPANPYGAAPEEPSPLPPLPPPTPEPYTPAPESRTPVPPPLDLPPIAPPPVERVAQPAPAAKSSGVETEYEAFIRASALRQPVPAPVVSSSAAKSAPGTSWLARFGLPVIAAINVVVLLTLAVVVYAATRPAPPASGAAADAPAAVTDSVKRTDSAATPAK